MSEFEKCEEMARNLIKEAKSPEGGFVTDHLAEAEYWMDRMVDLYKKTEETIDALMSERSSLIETKRAQIASLTADRDEWRKLAKEYEEN